VIIVVDSAVGFDTGISVFPAQHLWSLDLFSCQPYGLEISRILRSGQTVSEVYLKHISSVGTSAFGILGVLDDNLAV